jgi:hypothetical protein
LKRATILVVLAGVCLWFSVFFTPAFPPVALASKTRGFGQQAANSPNSQPGRAKIAEGEYVVVEQANFGAVGPFGEEVYDFHETWTMWRNDSGEYEVEGKRQFESPKDSPHEDSFQVRLSRDLTVIDLTEFSKLRWRADSESLSCGFLPNELHCFSDARDPKQEVDLHAPMEHPFGLLWPISAFSLSGITREAERNLNRPTEVQFASIEQPNEQNPVEVTTLNGQLRYLGEMPIELAGENWRAYKFSLRVALHPEFLIWTSPKGLLLSLSVEHAHKNWPEEGLKLVRFRKWADF